MIVTAIGVSVLVAWYVHFVPLVQVRPDLVPMHRMTALAAAFSGAALILLSKRRKRAAAFFSLLTFAIVVVVCAEYSLNQDLGFDSLLGPTYADIGTPNPGRMSPVTALCYLGSSVALLVLCNRNLSRFASALAGVTGSAVAAVGIVSLCANLLWRHDSFTPGNLTGISVQSGVTFAFLGFGLMALAWEEGLSRKSEWLPVGVGIAVAAAVLGIWRALLEHEESDMALISAVILGGGLLVALLVAIAVHLARKAILRSRELEEGKAAFERLFDASADALLVVDHDGRILRANQRIEPMFGYKPQEIVGCPIESLVPIDRRTLHHVHRHNYFDQPEARLMGPGLDLYGRRENASQFPADVSLSPLQSGRELQVLASVRDITERKQAEEALRQSEERFRGLFETSPLGLVFVTPDYRLAKVNASMCRISGYSEAELLNTNPLDYTHPEDRDESARMSERLFKGEIPFYQIEKRFIRKNGEIFWGTLTASILRDREGRPAYGLGMVEDITERKRQEEALRQSEELFRGLVEQSPIGVTLIGMDYRFIKVNPAFSRMLGYSEAELTRMTALDLTLSEDRPATVNLAASLFSGGPFQKIEKRYITKSGQIIWARINASVIHDSQGKPIYGMGLIEDITDRKRAEEELRVLSQRLSLAVRTAALGVWEWDSRTELEIWNERMFQIFGLPPRSHVPREEWQSRIHREDLPRVDLFMDNVIRNRAPETCEFRIALPDGALRYVSAVGGPILDEKGNATGVVGVALDVTERKQAEQKLAEQAALLDLAHDAIFACDLEGRITFWSRGARDTYGWSASEAVGLTTSELLHTEFTGPLHEIRATVLIKGGWEGELVHTTRDGKKLVMASRWSLQRDDDGAPQAILQINRDISARKQLEEQIETSREQSAATARLSALGMMAGGVAHEINNPLAIIHALASDLIEEVEDRGSVPPETVARSSRRILETTERIAHIVKSLRKISREGTKDRYYPVRVGKILDETLEVTRARFEARGVELILPGSIPDLTVSVREVQIEQVVLNLLQNAFDAVVDQPGERWVRLDVTAREGCAVVSVIDSGPGIPPDLRDYVGQPFFTTKEVGKGAGLGLSLSKTIAEEHGGNVEYDEEGGHTRFSLVLPLVRQAGAA
jgi:PAS domain S-box-containing protein